MNMRTDLLPPPLGTEATASPRRPHQMGRPASAPPWDEGAVAGKAGPGQRPHVATARGAQPAPTSWMEMPSTSTSSLEEFSESSDDRKSTSKTSLPETKGGRLPGTRRQGPRPRQEAPGPRALQGTGVDSPGKTQDMDRRGRGTAPRSWATSGTETLSHPVLQGGQSCTVWAVGSVGKSPWLHSGERSYRTAVSAHRQT